MHLGQPNPSAVNVSAKAVRPGPAKASWTSGGGDVRGLPSRRSVPGERLAQA